MADYLPDDETFVAKNVSGTKTRLMLDVFSNQLKLFEELANIFTNEMSPECADQLMENWEKMLGIPDDCFSIEGISLEDRQRNALVKLAKMNVQTTEEFKSLADSFGIEATVQSGIDYANSSGYVFPGGDTEARFTVVITFISQSVDAFPLTFPTTFGLEILGILECVFSKIKPANCNVLFITEAESVPENWDPNLEEGDSGGGQSVTYSDEDRVATITDFGSTTRVSLGGSLIRSTSRRYIEFEILNGQATGLISPITTGLIQSGRLPGFDLVGDVDTTRIAGFEVESATNTVFDGHWIRAYLNETTFSNGFKTVFRATNDVLAFDIDFDNADVIVLLNNVVQGSLTGLPAGYVYGPIQPRIILPNTTLWSVKLNQRSGEFVYSLPSGTVPWADAE
ncbi:MAG: YmfQ family protein [Actinomycetia bacterium]|nr:YmfQ family protein [Actinomycetes bacterium]